MTSWCPDYHLELVICQNFRPPLAVQNYIKAFHWDKLWRLSHTKFSNQLMRLVNSSSERTAQVIVSYMSLTYALTMPVRFGEKFHFDQLTVVLWVLKIQMLDTGQNSKSLILFSATTQMHNYPVCSWTDSCQVSSYSGHLKSSIIIKGKKLQKIQTISEIHICS